jgi:FkbM family methyltransferase
MKILNALKNRLSYVKTYFENSNYKRIGFKEFYKNIIAPPCEIIAKKFAKKMHEDNEYDYYSIKSYSRLFNYPKLVPYHHFAQVISEGMQSNHWHFYEIPETCVLKDEIIVDCGSAEGFFAFKYENIARKIYAVELSPIFVNSLEKLFAGKRDVVEVIPVAVGDENGEMYLEPSNIASQIKSEVEDSMNYVRVPICKIDTLFFEQDRPFTYLKADLEGYEEKMILGALQSIKAYKPKIAITTYHIGQDYKSIVDTIKSIVPEYNFKIKGYEYYEGKPVMLHMWI